MSNSNEAEIDKNLNTKIENNLNNQFPEDIRKWLRKNDPELYLILLSKLLPKSREQLLLQKKLEEKEADLEKQEKWLKNAEIEVAATTAALRFWERDTPVIIFPGAKFWEISVEPLSVRPWSFFNTFFDWMLKVGLSVVPILSLFSIFTISDLTNLQYSPTVLVGILCGTSLVWLTSATVINWIVSQEDEQRSQKNNQVEEQQNQKNVQLEESQQTSQDIWINRFREIRQSFREICQTCFPLITQLTKVIFPIPILTELIRIIVGTNLIIDPNTFLFFIIWLLEALIGYATVPPLIDLARSNNINLSTAELSPLPPLTGEQKFEILFGVSIFAFINIMFAIAKGRIYRVNTKKKVALGKAIARRDMQKILRANCQSEILELKSRNQELEQLLRPDILIEKFHQGIENLSIWARQGKDYSDIPDDISTINITNNGNLGSPNIPVKEKPAPAQGEPENTPNQ